MTYPKISAPPGQVPDGCVIVTLPGEIDWLNASAVTDSLLTVLNRGANGLIVDMTGTYFCDAAGCRAVIRASGRARLLGTWVRAVVSYPCVGKVFTLLGADHLVPVCTSLDDALAAARADAASRLS